MDPKDIFERRSRRGVGPMEPAALGKAGLLDSVESAVFERLPLPIKDDLPRALEFRRKTRSWFSFPYHCLMNLEYHPHDRITLGFTTHLVVVRGRNLARLYDGIRQQTCQRVEEMDRSAMLEADETDPEIRKIEIVVLGGDGPTACAEVMPEL